MQWSRGRRAVRAALRTLSVAGLVIGTAVTLAACNPDNRPTVAAAQPRGATVAFESIDGPPETQFRALVHDLNSEAQVRQIAVISRQNPSAYRVRGYLAATVENGRTTISWVWDVFDRDQRRALRINGSEIAKANQGRGWKAADEAMMQRIAKGSMAELATFLTSRAVAPGTPDTGAAQVAFAMPDLSSPEAAGIFRVFRPNADPVPAPAPEAMSTARTDAIPLPPRRPAPLAAVSGGETVSLAATRH